MRRVRCNLKKTWLHTDDINFFYTLLCWEFGYLSYNLSSLFILNVYLFFLFLFMFCVGFFLLTDLPTTIFLLVRFVRVDLFALFFIPFFCFTLRTEVGLSQSQATQQPLVPPLVIFTPDVHDMLAPPLFFALQLGILKL